MVGLPVPNMITMESPHTKPPAYEFLNLYGPACDADTEDPNEAARTLHPPSFASQVRP
jgi:hypothetical protein